MKVWRTLVFLLIGLSAISAWAAEVGGVKVEEKSRFAEAGPELLLNGAGIRTKVFFKVYVGALYLTEKKTDAKAVLADAGPKRVAMHMLRDLSAQDLVAALNDGLNANHTEAELAPLAARIKEFTAIMTADKDIRTGGVILLDYIPGTGTRMTVNGAVKGTIPGDDFYRALLKIWLGDKPVDAGLKKAMLGGA